MLRLFNAATALIFTLLANSVQASVGIEQLQNRTEGMAYYYVDDSLEAQWHKLHSADAIAYPSAANIQQLLSPYLDTELEAEVLPTHFNRDYSSLAKQVQESWRLFHAGQYKDAYHLSSRLGLAGLLPKLRSLAINHHFFVTSREDRKATFAGLIREIEQVQAKYRLESASIYLLKAFAIGRYGQEMSPVSAFAKGLGGKLKRNIYKAAALAPDNAEAIMFKAVFDAEAINHAGSITSKLLYGSSKKRSRKNFKLAIQAAPHNTALLLEYGKACLYICPRKEREEGYKTLQELSKTPVLDLGDLENTRMAKDIIDQKPVKQRPEAAIEQAIKSGTSA